MREKGLQGLCKIISRNASNDYIIVQELHGEHSWEGWGSVNKGSLSMENVNKGKLKGDIMVCVMKCPTIHHRNEESESVLVVFIS